MRELVHRVNAEGCIELDTNACSVPWRLIGETVTVVVSADTVVVEYASEEVARHAELSDSLPICVHTFREIREEGHYYVDKTDFAHQLIDEGSITSSPAYAKPIHLIGVKFSRDQHSVVGFAVETPAPWSGASREWCASDTHHARSTAGFAPCGAPT